MRKNKKYMIVVIISICLFCGCSDGNSGVFYSEKYTESIAADSECREETGMPEPETETVGEIYVQIGGAVYQPGVYKVSSDLRIFQVIELAGGITDRADINAVNMARPVTDEMYIYIPAAGETTEMGLPDTGTEPTVGQSNGKININTASKEELMTLKGIGEAKAEAILLYREESGGFTDISQIMNISGIKEAAFNKIKDYIAIE